MANYTYSDNGLALTKRFEGLRLNSYADSGGVWTVGWGHTGAGVYSGLTITEEEAETFLMSDIAASVVGVNRMVKANINQNHFDALVDFTFNLGCASLSQSTLLRYINTGDFASAAPQFLLWDHCHGVVVSGLLARRQAEMDLFNT